MECGVANKLSIFAEKISSNETAMRRLVRMKLIEEFVSVLEKFRGKKQTRYVTSRRRFKS